VKNNWYNRTFHKKELEQFQQAEAMEQYLREKASKLAFERLHNNNYAPVVHQSKPLTVKQDEELLKVHPKKHRSHYEGDSHTRDSYIPIPVFIPTSSTPSHMDRDDDRPSFSPGGGSFGGGGASASWEPSSSSSSSSDFSDVSSGSSSSSDSGGGDSGGD
jgi:uncharacterized membrane protein YgcG